jgi:predicted tellurium resistance membrane protein TerC
VQIVLLDIVLSLDSVITAVGMANAFSVMATAIVVAVLIMLGASGPVSGFVNRHPTVKMLALSFLLLIGMARVADAAGFHVPKGYIYAAIGFSVMVEALNQLAARRRRFRISSDTRPDEILSKRSNPDKKLTAWAAAGAASRSRQQRRLGARRHASSDQAKPAS